MKAISIRLRGAAHRIWGKLEEHEDINYDRVKKPDKKHKQRTPGIGAASIL